MSSNIMTVVYEKDNLRIETNDSVEWGYEVHVFVDDKEVYSGGYWE